MASSPSGSDRANSRESTSPEKSSTHRVSPKQLGGHQEQQRRTLLPPESGIFLTPHSHRTSSLPFPLNLPPSYSVYPSSSPPMLSGRPQRPPLHRQSVSLSATQLSTKTSDATEGATRVRNAPSASSSKEKGKGTLDTFMNSRQRFPVNEPESSGSDSDAPQRKKLVFPSSDDYPLSDSSALPSSSPPSSSPIRTPKGSSPFLRMYEYASSPAPKRPSQSSSNLPFNLPPGPYSLQKPIWSLSALIGQALNASRSGSLALNDIYSYVSTVYPHYDRAEQSWMGSIRHNLSLQDAFERVPEEGDKTKSVKKKSKGKGGFWRIKPGYEVCFVGGSYVKKGARGAGPGLNHTRKRPSQDEGEHKDKRLKAERSTSRSPSVTPIPSMSTHSQMLPRRHSPTRNIYSDPHFRRLSSPPSLTTSQSTAPSEESPPDPSEPSSSTVPLHRDNGSVDGSPDLPLALIAARHNASKGRSYSLESALEAGFELSRISGIQQSYLQRPALETQDVDVNEDLFTRVLASTSSAHASLSQSLPSSSPNPVRLLFPPPFASQTSSSSPLRTTTPPPPQHGDIKMTFSPARTPMSHMGVHMSPSRSLAHYKSSLEPEWKNAGSSSLPERGPTPPPLELGDETTSTPRKLVFPPGAPQVSPFRTPTRSTTGQRNQRGYDPYDPNTLLADELASIRNANDPQESPGGFFGKEGRRLLYESPGIPSRSHWRFRDEL